MAFRDRQFNLIVGCPKAGKSTFISKVIDDYQNGNVLVFKHIINYDDPAFKKLPIKTETNWRQGVAPNAYAKFKMLGDEETYPKFLQWIYGKDENKFKNGLLVIDDCSMFEEDRLSWPLKRILGMRRHKGLLLDIWLVYHSLTDLPIKQFQFVNNIVLFNTNDNLKYKSSKIPALENAVNQARANFRSKENRYTPAIVRLS